MQADKRSQTETGSGGNSNNDDADGNEDDDALPRSSGKELVVELTRRTGPWEYQC
jgi:hypothetical protein